MTALILNHVGKSFTLHLQGGVRIEAVRNISFEVQPGRCVVLGGPSGAGKSSILKMIYGNYRIDTGSIRVRAPDGRMVDLATASPRLVLDLRRTTLGYVSQFLRVIPRVGALDIVTEAAGSGDLADPAARAMAKDLLTRLNIPERLWSLPPATFSGGEQQRVNIARGLAARRPVLLLDEPTASLDAENRRVVEALIADKKRSGVAIVAICHDDEVREAIADHVVDVTRLSTAAAA